MKNKLALKDLKVKSFVTDITGSKAAQLKGGADLGSMVCLTGLYPTLPVQNCVTNGTN